MTGIIEIWDKFIEFISSGGTISIFGSEIPIFGFYGILLSVIIILLFNFILKKQFQKVINRNKLPPNLYNGIIFFLRIFLISLITWLLLTFLGVEWDFIWIIIGIITTAITFASMKTINNFIAGVWLALNQPYIVGDYVKIGSTEGIIKNISPTYTQIIHNDATVSFIPNVECLNASIINFTLSITEIKKNMHRLEHALENLLESSKIDSNDTDEENDMSINRIKGDIMNQKVIIDEIEAFDKEFEKQDHEKSQKMKTYSQYVQKGKIVNYIFTLDLPKTYKENTAKLNRVCQKWIGDFDFRPHWELINIASHFRYQFTIITPDPLDIVNFHDDFVTGIYRELYQ